MKQFNLHNYNIIYVLACFLLGMSTSASAQEESAIGNLAMGYITPWTAKVIFNAEGGYNGQYNTEESNIHGWSKLYEACEADCYKISLPTTTANASSARVQFKTTIDIKAGHTYKFQFRCTSDNYMKSMRINLSESDDDQLAMISESKSLSANKEQTLTYRSTPTRNINNLKLELAFNSTQPNTTVSIRNITLYDETSGQELWVGTSYFNWCYYFDETHMRRIADMAIEGRTESMSWTKSDFDDSDWDSTPMPIGNQGYINEVQTIWPGGDNTNYWIRRDFTIQRLSKNNAYFLRVCHDDAYSIYVNGHLMHTDQGWTDGKNPLEIEVPFQYLQEGKNVIATYIQQNWGGKFYDCGMRVVVNAYDDGDEDADITTALIATEVNVANIDQTIDYAYSYGGWLELYNKSESRISLRNIFISDDASQLTKFTLPDLGVMEPHTYKCIFFGNNAQDGTFGPLAYKQVRFKLSTGGGQLYLSKDGATAFLNIAYPEAIARCSYARKSLEADEWGYNGTPTPEAANTQDFAQERLTAPLVSEDSQLFSIPFHTQVQIPEGATLRYTTDGTTPTLENGITSTDGTFEISKTTVLRLRLFQQGLLPSQVVTRSYIYRDKDYYLPVIAITTNPDNLYDNTIGVYVDGTNGVEGRNHGKSNINMDWERPVNFEYITPEGQMVINQEAEFNISGGWSRHYAPASFKLKASKLYEGNNSFDFPFFSLKPYNKYKQLLVRNGGNDNDSRTHGRVRDAITQQTLISNGFYVDAQDYQPAHVFFNGKYIGMLNLREPNNRYNGTANYGYNDDEMDAFEYSNGYFQMAGTRDAFDEWISLAQKANTDEGYEKLRQMVDMDEYINYMAAISYIGCSDWICNNNNLKGYRSLPDGKFHLTVLDQDWGWANSNGVSLINNNYNNDMLKIYNYTKRHSRFRKQFVDTYCLLGGSVFTPERCKNIGDSICYLVAPALEMEGKTPWASYNEQRSNMTSSTSRKARMDALRSAYGLANGMAVRFSANVPHAALMLDSLPVPGNNFDGTLFAPVTLTASAPAGYVFKGWQNNGQSYITLFPAKDVWLYYDEGSLDGTNWQAPDFDEKTWKSGPAPLGYYTGGARDYQTILSYGGNKDNKYPTYYFRKAFTLNNAPSADDTFTLNYTADDGFVIYVNGVEATRYLMPEGTITYSTFATTFAQGNPDNGTVELPASLFHEGVNTIAVELHNNVPGSTDIYWNAELLYATSHPAIITKDAQLTLATDQDATYTAIFEPMATQAERLACGGMPVRINEVSANNGIYINEQGKREDWIELYNTTDHDINIEGMYLSDDIENPQKSQIQVNDAQLTTIPPHGKLILWADKKEGASQLHLPFKLKNEADNYVTIMAEDASWRDVFLYGQMDSRHTFGRYPDGSNFIYDMNVPTIGKQNMLCSYDVFINEYLFKEDPDREDNVADLLTSDVVRTEYYSLAGEKLTRPRRGICIQQTFYTNGSIMSKKIVIK